MPQDSVTITDHRTGNTIESPVSYGTYPNNGASTPSLALRELKMGDDDFGMLGYDPAFMNTASCKSSITFIDGEKGVLRYRGYPIEQLAENSNFLETAFLLMHGELPTGTEYQVWVDEVTNHTLLHENIKHLIDAFWHDAHPMGMLTATVAAMSTFYPDSKNVTDADSRHLQIIRLLAKLPTVAAFAYRRTLGRPYAHPNNRLSYAGNFMNMLFKTVELQYEPDPVLEKALDVLFVLHADHEQNCSTTAVRCSGSALTDPYCAIAAGCGALYGPLHGGANEAVLRMLTEIEKVENIPAFIETVKGGERRLMGFGHRVYKNYDPRAQIIKQTADRVFEVTGRNSLTDIALELERVALEDDYFVSRKLYPNVDFYSGLIYQAMGFPTDFFPVLFAIGRTAGWLAQWQELLTDPEQRISRPRQIYTGSKERDYVPMDARS